MANCCGSAPRSYDTINCWYLVNPVVTKHEQMNRFYNEAVRGWRNGWYGWGMN